MAATRQLTVTAVHGSGAQTTATDDAAYSSSDEAVATVDSSGLVTAHAAGTATITATYAGKSDTCAVTVTTEEA